MLASPCLASALFLLAASAAFARTPAYLDEFPDPQRIVRDFQGKDPFDTAALQTAMFNRLTSIMFDMAGDRVPNRYPNPDEEEIIKAINAVAGPIVTQAIASLPAGTDLPYHRLRERQLKYEHDRALNERLMKLYFTPQFPALYAQAKEANATRSSSFRQNNARQLRAMRGEAETTWTRMSPEEQGTALRWGAGAVLLLLFALVREARPFRFDKSNPRILKAGFGRCRIDFATGRFDDYEEWTCTKTVHVSRQVTDSRHPGHKSSVQQAVVTTQRHERFSLNNGLGKHTVHVAQARTDAGVPLLHAGRAGRRVTAAWVLHGKKRRGDYFAIHDWTTRESVTEGTPGFGRSLAVAFWPILPAMVLGFVVGHSTELLGTVLARDLRGAVLALAAGVVWFAMAATIGSVRTSRFEKKQLPAFFAAVGEGDAMPENPLQTPDPPKEISDDDK